MKEHRTFMQTKSQDTVIVPVMFTGRAMGSSKITDCMGDECDDDETQFQSRDKHTDDDEYDNDSPAGYRNAAHFSD